MKRRKNGRQMVVILAVLGGVFCIGLGNAAVIRVRGETAGKVLEKEASGEPERGEETDLEMESETETGTETDSESESESETETETEAETEAETESGGSPEPELPETELPESETLETEPPEPETPEAELPESETLEAEQPEPETPEPETLQPEAEIKPETEPGSEQETEPPRVPVRDVDYELTGDPDCWFRDRNDILWVRAGTGLTVKPKGECGFNTGKNWENLQKDGEAVFRLREVDQEGIILKKSAKKRESYCVDGEAPMARITASGSMKGGVVYASGSSNVSIQVEPDGKSGLKSSAYKITPCGIDGTSRTSADAGAWTECGMSSSARISSEGIYRVYVKTEDMVGNTAFSSSSVICVDCTGPEISVSGAVDQTANAGSVRLRISCSDAFYRPGSLQAEISGVNQGNVPSVADCGSDSGGAWITFYDFPKLQDYDDVYELQVSAEDLAGNRKEKKMTFSVNRFGSVYDLSGKTKTLLAQYFLSAPDDIVFYETNIDYVGESAVFCRHDGQLRSLSRGKDYNVTMEGTDSSWKRYCYTVPASYFSSEGIYELLLTSRDAASNSSDTGMQQKRVTFVLDWTAPDCTMSGIQSGGIYEEDEVTVRLTPTDNTGLRTLKIYHNSELLREEDVEGTGEDTVKFTLGKEDSWQTVQVYLCDLAGNEYWSSEVPVFVGAAGIEVPAYRKMRKSAKELESGKGEETDEESEEEREEESEEETEEGLFPAHGEEENAGMDAEAAREEAESAKETVWFSGVIERNLFGSALLCLSLLLFAGTVIFLIAAGTRKTK